MISAARLDSLTSLRWFLAFAVCARHLAYFWPEPLHRLTMQGATGVSAFFILSGFVLTWSRRPRDSAAGFWRRRFARIFPSNAVIWLIAIPVGILWEGRAYDAGQLASSLFLFHAWFPDWTGGTNGVAWSLSDEVFFYALFPVFVVFAYRLRRELRRPLMLGGVAVMLLLALILRSKETDSSFFFLYYFPPVRFLEFAIGVLLALEVRDGHWPHIPVRSAAALAIGAYVLAGFLPDHLMWSACTVVPFALLIGAMAQSDIAGRRSWLQNRRLVVLGEVSFAFYLVHPIVIRALYGNFRSLGSNVVAYKAAFLVLALGLAVISAFALHRFVERPFERRLRGSHVDRLSLPPDEDADAQTARVAPLRSPLPSI